MKVVNAIAEVLKRENINSSLVTQSIPLLKQPLKQISGRLSLDKNELDCIWQTPSRVYHPATISVSL